MDLSARTVIDLASIAKLLRKTMTRYTRQEAKALGLPTCYGSACKKHPEFEGLRRVSGACVECARINLQKSRRSDPERTRLQSKKDSIKLRANVEYVQRKREADKAYRKENKQRCRAVIAEWSKRNPDKVKLYAQKTKRQNKGRTNADTAKRRYAKLQRTPQWLTSDDYWMIEQAYELAALRTKLFGFSWHVDHIIPLQGEQVSGLHVPTNLQVIPWLDNVVKANKFEVAT